MLKRYGPILALIMILLTIIACEGGTSGSVVGSSEDCRYAVDRGACDGKFNKLSGTFGKDFEDDDISSSDILDVEVEVSVESGPVNVSVKSPDGGITSIQVRPNHPGTLVAQAKGDFGSFEVTFEAVEGEALNVVWSISYQVR